MQNTIIWSNTQNFYRLTKENNTNALVEQFLITPKTSAIEIILDNNLHREISPKLISDNFQYCSIHAPVYTYQDDKSSHIILQTLDQMCQKYPIQNIVIHPNKVKDRKIFSQYPHLPLSIENMDNEKSSCKNVADLAKIFEKSPQLKFTLDLQHSFVNDPTMQLAKDFHTAFGDRLVEYHISGHTLEYIHYPLFKTEQIEIIHAIQNPHLPFIIESTFDSKEELDKEIEYITQNIIYS